MARVEKSSTRWTLVGQCYRGSLGKGGGNESWRWDQVPPPLPVFTETPLWTLLRMNGRAPNVNLVSQHNIQCLGCCPPLRVRDLTRKRLSNAWALSVIHIPFSQGYKCTEKNANTFLVIFTLHARTYIKIHTQTHTHDVSLEGIKMDKPFLAALQSLLELHRSYTSALGEDAVTTETGQPSAHHQPCRGQAGNKTLSSLQSGWN